MNLHSERTAANLKHPLIESNLSCPQDYHNYDNFYEPASLGENFSNCERHSTCNYNTDYKDHDLGRVHIKEELILDSFEPNEEYDDYNENPCHGSQNNFSDTISIQAFASNENILDADETTRNKNILNIQISQENIPDGILLREYNQQKNYLSGANLLKKRQRKHKNLHATLNLLRMYCHTCDRSSKQVNLKEQQNCYICQKSMKFHCAKCKSKFKNYSSAYQHIKYKCSNASFLKCSKCNYKTRDKRCLVCHMKHRHSANQCINCGSKYKNYAAMKKHQQYECKLTQRCPNQKLDLHNFMEDYCKPCNKVVSKDKSLNIQQCSECKKDMQIRCVKCKHQCDSYMSIYCHLKFKCEKTDLYCNECYYKTPYKVNLSIHIQNQHMPRKCDECGEKFEDRVSLKLHKKSHKRRRKIIKKAKHEFIEMYCTKCDKAYNNELYSTLTNCQECSSLLKYRCKVCAKKFYNYKSVYNHTKYSCTKGNLITCSMCEISIPLQSLQKHIRKTHTIQSCEKCGVKCENYSCLKQHKSFECSFRKDASTKCSLCDYLGTSKEVEKHMKFQHSDCGCTNCGIKCENYSDLKHHHTYECKLRIKAPVNCPMCNIIVTRTNLNRHIQNKHNLIDNKCAIQVKNENPFIKCLECSSVFMNSHNLKQHMILSHTIRICPSCHMKCDNFNCMKRHQLYECVFKTEQQKPMNGVVYDINVYCPSCKVAAKLIYGLKVTTCSTCQNLLKLQCGTCKTLYKNVKYVRRHIKHRCNKESTFSCLHCTFKTKMESEFRKHVKTCQDIDIVQNTP